MPEQTMNDTKSTVDPKLLEILVCPLTKGPLRYDHQAQELISDQADLAYPIRDGIPIMLIDEALIRYYRRSWKKDLAICPTSVNCWSV